MYGQICLSGKNHEDSQNSHSGNVPEVLLMCNMNAARLPCESYRIENVAQNDENPTKIEKLSQKLCLLDGRECYLREDNPNPEKWSEADHLMKRVSYHPTKR